MRYEREDLGFIFDLPDGWWQDKHNLTLSFHGPHGGLGINSELVQIKIGTILPNYISPTSREDFLAEPGAHVSRTRVGDEDNSVVLRRALDSEISVVRNGVHYTISHFHDPGSIAAIDQLKKTARFGSPQQAQEAIRSWSDPGAQAVARMLRATSPEEARDALARVGFPGTRVTGGTFHNIGERARQSQKPELEPEQNSRAFWWRIVLLALGWLVIALHAYGLFGSGDHYYGRLLRFESKAFAIELFLTYTYDLVLPFTVGLAYRSWLLVVAAVLLLLATTGRLVVG